MPGLRRDRLCEGPATGTARSQNISAPLQGVFGQGADSIERVLEERGSNSYRQKRRESIKMIQVMRIPMAKTKLSALSKDERVLLFLLGYVANRCERLLTRNGRQACYEFGDVKRFTFEYRGQTRLMTSIGLSQSGNMIPSQR
jgi:hypothetical protein